MTDAAEESDAAVQSERGDSSMMRATTMLKITVAALALQAGGALAQAEKDYRAYTPTVPDFTDELGVRLGSFILRPEASLSGEYDDNIFITADDEESDFILRFGPEVTLESDWARHKVLFTLGAEVGTFLDNDDDDYIDANARFQGTLDVSRATSARITLDARRLHERRGSVDTPSSTDGPTIYNVYGGRFDGRFKPASFRLSPFFQYSFTDYDDVGRLVGPDQNNDDRDRHRYGGGLEVGYEFQRGYEAFVRGEGDQILYQDSVDDNGFRRDSYGAQGLAGVKVDLTRLITGEFGAGFTVRDYYDDEDLGTVSGFSANAKATWSVTPLTTVILSASREIEETTVNSASGIFATTGELELVHSLRRDLLISAFTTVTDDEFDGVDRDDTTYAVGLGAEWVLNRNLSLEGRYEFATRDSSDADNEYDRNLVTIELKTRY